MKTLAVFVLGGLLVGAAPAARAVDVSGDWSLVFNTDQGQIPATLTVKQDGEKLTGTMTGGEGGTMSVEGSIKDGEFTLSFYYGDIPVTMSGKVDGSEAKGTFSAGSSGGDWSGKKVVKQPGGGETPPL